MVRARFGGPSRSAYPPLQGWLPAVLVTLSLSVARVACPGGGSGGGGGGGAAGCPRWIFSGEDQVYAAFGGSVASAGDVNGDGFADVIIGASGYGWPATGGVGKAYLFLGTPAGIAPTPAWESSGEGQEGAFFGSSVASAGDVNGDGFDDVVVGAPEFDTWIGASQGRAYLYSGGASGLEAIPAWTSSGDDQVFASFGFSVASAGDVNGDGFGDILIGARYYNAWLGGEGMAYLYLGGGSGLGAGPAWANSGETQPMAQFGYSVASAGDVDGDGFDDVIVGTPWFDTTLGEEGKAYLFLGEPAGLAYVPAWTSVGEDQGGAWFGTSVGFAGDVNGDGYCDVIVGASGYRTTGTQDGKAYLFLGGALGLEPASAWISVGDSQTDSHFGFSVASAGDVNGDGFFDVIVGAHSYTTAVGGEGKAYVYLGGASGLAPGPAWTSSGDDQGGADFGASVASAGDVNGNGLSAVVVGAGRFDTGSEDAGRAYLYCLPP